MDDPHELSDAARQLAVQRWGSSRPVRLARELALRAHELPPIERRALIAALSEDADRGQSSIT
jgi:hypothetical protein